MSAYTSAMSPLVIYGAYGYTGRLIVRECLRRNIEPHLAGRNRDRLAELASQTGLPFTVLATDDSSGLDNVLTEARAVLNCAGPFVDTAPGIVEACIRNRAHYLDVTGEIPVFEHCRDRHRQAQDAGICLIPGCGYDIVPTDSLSFFLHARLPSADSLELAVYASGSVSRGTAKTALRQLSEGGRVVENGRMIREALGKRSREVSFENGEHLARSLPFGDVVTAPFAYGFRNVTVYGVLEGRNGRPLPVGGPLVWLASRSWVQGLIRRWIERRPEGPDDETRERGHTELIGLVRDPDGASLRARLVTPEAYTTTQLMAAEIAERALDGIDGAGFKSPAQAFGPDLVIAMPGVKREVL